MRSAERPEQGSLDRSEGERRAARRPADQPETEGKRPGRANGAPAEGGTPFVGRGGARERRETCPAGRGERSGLCDDDGA